MNESVYRYVRRGEYTYYTVTSCCHGMHLYFFFVHSMFKFIAKSIGVASDRLKCVGSLHIMNEVFRTYRITTINVSQWAMELPLLL